MLLRAPGTMSCAQTNLYCSPRNSGAPARVLGVDPDTDIAGTSAGVMNTDYDTDQGLDGKHFACGKECLVHTTCLTTMHCTVQHAWLLTF